MDRENLTKTYSNGTLTVVWKPGLCIHSTNCWKGLITVFNPRTRPWINMEGADSERIVEQVKKCPSAALSFYYNEGAPAPEGPPAEEMTRVEAQPNGPLLVHGRLTVVNAGGGNEEKNGVTAFCRCGLSANKPYCDGSHVRTRIDG